MNRKQRRAAVRRQQAQAGRLPSSGSIADQIKTAFMLQRAGRLAEAGSCLAAVLAKEPDNVTALQLMGVTQAQMGDDESAVTHLEWAAALAPDNVGIYSNLARAFKQAGRLDEAVAACRRAIAIDPDFTEAYINLGVALEAKDDLAQAAQAYETILNKRSDHAVAHNNLGNIRLAQDATEDAITCYRRALEIDPDFAQAHNNLGNALKSLSRWDEAEAAYRTALALRPTYVEAQYNLGTVLSERGQFAESIAAFRAAVANRPDFAGAYTNMGHSLRRIEELRLAVLAYRRSIEIEPDNYRPHHGLARVLMAQGKVEDAIAEYRQAVALGPSESQARSDLLLCLNYSPNVEAPEILAESKQWDQVHAAPLAAEIGPHSNLAEPDRRLRIGYVSPNFRTHSVSYFIEPVLRAHDRAAFDVVCYADNRQPDSRTDDLRGLADQWRDITDTEDADLADLIRQDEVDILVDLTGHTAGNRLLAFARRPAPVQVTWIGYPNTTGLSAIDYRLTDGMADPPGESDSWHTERLIRLSRFLCYVPPANAGDVTPVPATAAGRVTFGSFNHLPKVTPDVIALWAQILRAVPQSCLALKSGPLGDNEAREHYLDLLARHGIDSARVDLLAWEPDQSTHFSTYGQIDIALDPFPYNGTTTTCEALWMGVPVITLAGDRHAGRVGHSLLRSVGLDELVAGSKSEYVDKAVALATDLDRLSVMRSSLRDRMRDSALCNADEFAPELEAAYREMWRQWCDEQSGGEGKVSQS